MNHRLRQGHCLFRWSCLISCLFLCDAFRNKPLSHRLHGQNTLSRRSPDARSIILRLKNQTDEENKESSIGVEKIPTLLSRFTSPVIDDPALPLSDAMVSQVVAPSIQVAWLSLNHAPQPTWLRPIFDQELLFAKKGAFLAPALIHGAALASCWLMGALAARAYEKSAIVPDLKEDGYDYSQVFIRVCQAGAFATGLLILSTQLDLLVEFGRWVQLGESEETDFRLYIAAVELLNDVFFEAACLITWRLFLARDTVKT